LNRRHEDFQGAEVRKTCESGSKCEAGGLHVADCALARADWLGGVE